MTPPIRPRIPADALRLRSLPSDSVPEAHPVIDVTRHPFIGALRGTGELSQTQVDVLRKVVTDDGFRQSFLKDPMQTVVTSGVRISPGELEPLTRLTPEAFDALQISIRHLAAEDGTTTLVHAVAYAVVIALLLA